MNQYLFLLWIFDTSPCSISLFCLFVYEWASDLYERQNIPTQQPSTIKLKHSSSITTSPAVDSVKQRIQSFRFLEKQKRQNKQIGYFKRNPFWDASRGRCQSQLDTICHQRFCLCLNDCDQSFVCVYVATLYWWSIMLGCSIGRAIQISEMYLILRYSVTSRVHVGCISCQDNKNHLITF